MTDSENISLLILRNTFGHSVFGLKQEEPVMYVQEVLLFLDKIFW